MCILIIVINDICIEVRNNGLWQFVYIIVEFITHAMSNTNIIYIILSQIEDKYIWHIVGRLY